MEVLPAPPYLHSAVESLAIALRRSLKLLLMDVITSAACFTVASWVAVPILPAMNGPQGESPGLALWALVALMASALPVHAPRGAVVSVSCAPTIVAAALGGPTAAALVALFGSTELREVRGEVPWYGSLWNMPRAFSGCLPPA